MIPEPHRRFAAAIGRALARRWSAQFKNRTGHDDEKEPPKSSSTECNQSDGIDTVADSDSIDQPERNHEFLD